MVSVCISGSLHPGSLVKVNILEMGTCNRGSSDHNGQETEKYRSLKQDIAFSKLQLGPTV